MLAVLLVLVGIVGIPAVAVATARRHTTGLKITVRPTSGSPTTRFVVSFVTPARTGRVGLFDRHDEISVRGPTPNRGCVAGVIKGVPGAAAHARVTATLDPARLGGEWCAGAYRGLIEQIARPRCVKGRACPEFASQVRALGRFAFQVRSVATDTTPPVFAGFQMAFACTPGPQRPGETTPFTLTWTAATDNVTQSSQIV